MGFAPAPGWHFENKGNGVVAMVPDDAPTSWTVTLAVDPVPKGRPRMGHGHVYTPERTATFENTVRWLLRQAHIPVLEGDLAVTMTFWVSRHGSDWDNYAKAVCDACNGIGWKDDRQIKEAHTYLHKVAGGITPHIEFTARVLLRSPQEQCPAGVRNRLAQLPATP
jgi:Holliday junction resolvase RusA-like endonuclease